MTTYTTASDTTSSDYYCSLLWDWPRSRYNSWIKDEVVTIKEPEKTIITEVTVEGKIK